MYLYRRGKDVKSNYFWHFKFKTNEYLKIKNTILLRKLKG